jgi:hypothetical protein
MFNRFGTTAIFTSFGPLQDALRRSHFRWVDEVESAFDRLAQYTKEFCRGICALVEGWKRCAESGVDCAEEMCRKWCRLRWRLWLRSVFAINNFIYSFRFPFKWPLYVDNVHTCEGCPESIRTFWISRQPVAWNSCNLAANQRIPYSASVNSNSPVGLVSRQWDAVDWASVLCDCRIHKSPHFQWRF